MAAVKHDLARDAEEAQARGIQIVGSGVWDVEFFRRSCPQHRAEVLRPACWSSACSMRSGRVSSRLIPGREASEMLSEGALSQLHSEEDRRGHGQGWMLVAR